MEFRQLKYFITVAETRSISRAAALLNLTQPPLTRHIQALEDSLGVQLFKRTAWGVELTEAGTEFLKHARDIRAHVELASHQTQRTAAGQFGRIDVGVYGSAMIDVVPRLLEQFSLRHPDVEVVMQSAPKRMQLDALRRGHLLIAFDRYLPESGEVAVELVHRERMMLVLHKDSPLAKLDTVHISELRDQKLIGEVGVNSYERLAAICQPYGFTPQAYHRSADIISAIFLVNAGFGMTRAPASMARMQLPNIVYRPFETGTEEWMHLHCAYRRNETNPLLEEVLRIVREHREAEGIGEG